MFNDLGVGYYVYRSSGLVRGIAPTAEVHIATPLRQADPSVVEFGVLDDVRLHDVVDFTLGTTVELWAAITASACSGVRTGGFVSPCRIW